MPEVSSVSQSTTTREPSLSVRSDLDDCFLSSPDCAWDGRARDRRACFSVLPAGGALVNDRAVG